MTDPIKSLWTNQSRDAKFAEPKSSSRRMTKLERQVLIRNLIEYCAGALVLVLFGAATIMAVMASQFIMAVCFASTVVGVIYVIGTLYRQGRVETRQPENSCIDHLRGQLTRQRDLLRSVPKWYLAPLVPGVVGLYLTIIWEVAQVRGWAVAVEGLWLEFGGTLVFFVFVGWLNLRAARGLDREIQALPQ